MDKMNDINQRLDQIRDVWNNYIFKLKYFRKHYKFDAATSSNHFGQILDHFTDSLPVLDNSKLPSANAIHARYAFNISLLQTIYVQQDLMEEMHRIFKTNKSKKDLYLDENYKINREIRNELVGHPIRRKNGEMISSVTLSYRNKPQHLEYVRYHKSSNYGFEKIQHSVPEIIEKHLTFLSENLNQIYSHIHKSLKLFQKKIKEIEVVIKKGDFPGITRLVENYYETFQDDSYLYETGKILEVYRKKDEHERYQLVVDDYLFDLNYHLKEMTNTILAILENEEAETIGYPIQVCKHHYEVGKLFTKRNQMDFEFFGSSLRDQIAENDKAIAELDFMKLHIDKEVEYYSACNLLRHLLIE